MTYVPPGEASTSGRCFSPDRVISDDLKTMAGGIIKNKLYRPNAKINPEGLFYEEKGVYHKVTVHTPLIERFGYVIGIAENGYIHPVYNNRHEIVTALENNHNMQCIMTPQQAQKFGVGERLTHENVEHSEPPQFLESLQNTAAVKNEGNRRKQNRRARN